MLVIFCRSGRLFSASGGRPAQHKKKLWKPWTTRIRWIKVMKRSALDAARQFAWRKKSMVNGITDSTTSCAGSANKKSWKNLLTFKKILIYWSPLWEIWTKKNTTSHFTQLAKNPALDSRGSTPAALTSSQPLRLALKSSTNFARKKLSSSNHWQWYSVRMEQVKLPWLKPWEQWPAGAYHPTLMVEEVVMVQVVVD